MRFAVVALMPQDEANPNRQDFVNREFDSWADVPKFMAELEEAVPNWRAVTFVHVEDLPLLMEPPEGATITTTPPEAMPL